MKNEDRLEYEAKFHDNNDDRLKARRLSSLMVGDLFNEPHNHVFNVVREECPDKSVLCYGCGEGTFIHEMLFYGAKSITGIDISPGMIEKASSLFDDQRVNFLIMNCEQTEFDNNSFDLIVGIAILHHLDLNRAITEIHRLLKPGGKAIFLEPLGHNIFINLFRRLTPHARTPFEHPLKMGDISLIKAVFKRAATKEYVFLPLLAIPLKFMLPRNVFLKIINRLSKIDNFLLQHLVFLRYWFWIIVLELPKE